MNLEDYLLIRDMDDWGFTAEELNRCDSIEMEEDEESGFIYLNIYDEFEAFIAAIEFSYDEIPVMIAYMSEMFEAEAMLEYFDNIWDSMIGHTHAAVNFDNHVPKPVAATPAFQTATDDD